MMIYINNLATRHARAGHGKSALIPTFQFRRSGTQQATDKSVEFEGVVITVGQGKQMVGVTVGEVRVNATFIEDIRKTVKVSTGQMISADLRQAFPQMTGFSPRKVWYMRRLFEVYGTGDFPPQAVADSKPIRKSTALERQPVAKTEVPAARIQFLPQLVAEIPWGHHRLITRLQAFLIELGYGFCFVGRQYRITLGPREYFIDLLFYHRFLRTLVAFDLKVGPFEPEFAGKMDF